MRPTSPKLTLRDNRQFTFFRAYWRSLQGLDRFTRFATAIVATSDTAYEKAMREKPKLVQKWLNEYGNKYLKRKRKRR